MPEQTDEPPRREWRPGDEVGPRDFGITPAAPNPLADAMRRDASRPWYDPNLPPQLAEALEVMSRRGRVVELTAPWKHSRDVPCDEQCVCPVHGTPLIFWPAGGKHACRDVNCRHGHGMEDDR